jgi:parallel beta-helix repeat protein
MIRIQDRFALGVIGALLLTLIAALASVTYGGPLDPPAPPGSTQAGLIFQPANCAAFPIVITAPGSYKLAQNIDMPVSCAQDAIQITADDVSLDLAGFRVYGAGVGLSGINVVGSGYQLSISNGVITNFTSHGVRADGANFSRFDNLRVTFNGIGTSGDGIRVGLSGVVTGCECIANSRNGIVTSNKAIIEGNQVTNNGGIGIVASDSAQILDNVVSDNASYGISSGTDANVSGNIVTLNGGAGSVAGITGGGHVLISDNIVSNQRNNSDGIRVTAVTNSVTGNQVSANGGNGISLLAAADYSTVTDNNVANNLAAGIVHAGDGGTIARNTASSNFTTGILVSGFGNRIDENQVFGSGGVGVSISVSTGNPPNQLMRNTSNSNGGAAYSIGAGNQETGHGTLPTRTNPWDNINN